MPAIAALIQTAAVVVAVGSAALPAASRRAISSGSEEGAGDAQQLGRARRSWARLQALARLARGVDAERRGQPAVVETLDVAQQQHPCRSSWLRRSIAWEQLLGEGASLLRWSRMVISAWTDSRRWRRVSARRRLRAQLIARRCSQRRTSASTIAAARFELPGAAAELEEAPPAPRRPSGRRRRWRGSRSARRMASLWRSTRSCHSASRRLA